jgi:anti-anti-sigma regulatory factor
VDILKIEKTSSQGKTTIRLSGRFQSGHIEELRSQLQTNGPRFVLDLQEVTLVDLDVVRFLAHAEAAGLKITHRPPYIREWMIRERQG